MTSPRHKFPLPVVHIVWVDSCRAIAQWTERKVAEEELQEEHICETVGFLLKETSRSVSLALSVAWWNGEIGSVVDVMTIPKVAIKRRRRLG